MKKHAYLIMAHHQFGLLEQLLGLLDDERNDIFLHIDKKVGDFDWDRFSAVCQRARVIYPPKRIDVRWGTNSQVKCEMQLFQTAFRYGPYHYYHLLSGVDLPLHSQDDIHRRLEGESGSFLSWSDAPTQWDKIRIGIYRQLVPGWVPGSGRWNKILEGLQVNWKVDRLKNTGLTLHKGANWASLDQAGAACLVENRRLIRKMTRFSVCADEVYKQTLLLSRGMKVNRGDLRLVIWEEEDHPEILAMKHWPRLQASDRLFARKFDPAVDEEVIRRVIRKVNGEEDDQHCAAGL